MESSVAGRRSAQVGGGGRDEGRQDDSEIGRQAGRHGRRQVGREGEVGRLAGGGIEGCGRRDGGS